MELYGRAVAKKVKGGGRSKEEMKRKQREEKKKEGRNVNKGGKTIHNRGLKTETRVECNDE